MEAPLNILNSLSSSSEAVVLATIVSVEGSSPGKPGFKMLVYGGGRSIGSVGGGSLEQAVKDDAAGLMGQELPQLKKYDLTEKATGMWCGGKVQVLLEPFSPAPRLWIFGYGNVGKEVYDLVAGLPFSTAVIHHEKVEAIVLDAINWKTLEPWPEISQGDFVLLLTMDAELEFEILAKVSQAKPRYIGVIGSDRKAAKLKALLSEEGINLENLNLHMPVGLPIGAKTAREIAISIVAELIKVRHA